MKYSRSLDLILASMREAAAGKMETAATCFEKALKQKDLPATLAALEQQQSAAFDKLKQVSPTVAAMFDKVSAKLQKPAVAAPAAKKDVKASTAKPAKAKKVEKAADEDLDPVLDDMTLADDGEGVDGMEFDDLTLEDLEGLDDGIDEMPLASADEEDDKEEAADDADDEKDDDKKSDKEEADEDGDEDKDDEDEDDADDKKDEKASVKSKLTLVSANLDALTRLQENRKKAAKKPAK